MTNEELKQAILLTDMKIDLVIEMVTRSHNTFDEIKEIDDQIEALLCSVEEEKE